MVVSPRLISSRGGQAASGGKVFTIFNNNMHYVYILYSKKVKKLYKGNCSDLKIRIDNHNSHKVKSTKNGTPWKLIYYQAFISKTDAIREEIFLKTGKGRERIKYLFKNYFENLK